MKTSKLRNSISPASVRSAVILFTFALGCFLPSQTTEAGLAPTDTAYGTNALFNENGGAYNSAFGVNTLYSNMSGQFNIATGYQALYSNTTGYYNTASGANALYFSSTASCNTALGYGALLLNTASFNTASGCEALQGTSGAQNSGAYNVANGYRALFSNTTGAFNTASGSGALQKNTTGNYNTAYGTNALYFNEVGTRNTGIGENALQKTKGSSNIAVGFNAGLNLTTGNNNIDIGHPGVAAEASTIRIGAGQTRTFISGIRGRTTVNANAVPVVIDSAGQLGTASSSRRFKTAIKPMDQISEAILELEPVTFHYKSDSTDTPQFGLIAEEVAKVNPNLVVRDDNGEIYTVRYDAVNAMLLNEFLKEHRRTEELRASAMDEKKEIAAQKSELAQLRSTIADQQKQVAELGAQLNRVSARLEVSNGTGQTIARNH